MERSIVTQHSKIEELLTNMEKVIVGKRDTIELTIVALLAGGHVLLEDVPGVGKTMLVRALAKSLVWTLKEFIYAGSIAFRCDGSFCL